MHHKQLWLLTGILIAGIIVGYSVSLARAPNALSSSFECPANCTGDDCPMNPQPPTLER